MISYLPVVILNYYFGLANSYIFHCDKENTIMSACRTTVPLVLEKEIIWQV